MIPGTSKQHKEIKPPLGLAPKYLHDSLRKSAINDALDRYEQANLDVPKEWRDELRQLSDVVRGVRFDRAKESLEKEIKAWEGHQRDFGKEDSLFACSFYSMSKVLLNALEDTEEPPLKVKPKSVWEDTSRLQERYNTILHSPMQLRDSDKLNMYEAIIKIFNYIAEQENKNN